MSNNQIDEFEPLGDMLDRLNAERMASRTTTQARPDPGNELLADMDADRDRQIAQLSQTEHGRKVLAGHGIAPLSQEPAQPVQPPLDEAPSEDAPEDQQPDEGAPDAGGPDDKPDADQPDEDTPDADEPDEDAPDEEQQPENEQGKPTLHRGKYEIVRHGTEEDLQRGETLVGQVQQIYDHLIAAKKISEAGPHGVMASSVEYFNYAIREPGSQNSTIHALSIPGDGHYEPTMDIEFFLDGTASLRETLHTYAHELKHGDPDLNERYPNVNGHSHPVVEAVCNAYGDKVVEAYFGD